MKGDCGRRAFTILELLVVAAVLAVLVAILVPALRAARVAAGQTAMLSNLRGIGVSFDVYTQTYDNYYPFHVPSDWLLLTPPPVASMVMDGGNPWSLRRYWPAKFHSVAPWRDHFRTWVNDGRYVVPGAPWMPDEAYGVDGCDVSYEYSCSFQARPQAWPEPGAAPAAEESTLQAAVRAAEVAQPAAKALCIDADRAYLRRDARHDDLRGVLCVDGSARPRLDSEATAPAQNLINDRRPSRWHDTPRGVRGRDLR